MRSIFKISVLLISFMAMQSCVVYDNWIARKDFVKACKIAENIKGDLRGPDAAAEWEDKLFNSIRSRSGEMALRALVSIDEDERYRLFLESAADVGLKNYECLALKKAWSNP